MLFPLLLLVAVGFVILTLMAPGRAFLPAFAELLTEPALQQSPLSFFSGRSYVLADSADERWRFGFSRSAAGTKLVIS
jgi:hypothetical protein